MSVTKGVFPGSNQGTRLGPDNKCLIKIPWNIITSIPTFAVMKMPVENSFSSRRIDDNIQLEPAAQTANQGPSVDEIAITSATELASVAIRFEPTHGGLSSVTFDANAATMHLPEISLDVNSEVLLRNLVAYEAAIVTGSLMFTRYVELMNGVGCKGVEGGRGGCE